MKKGRSWEEDDSISECSLAASSKAHLEIIAGKASVPDTTALDASRLFALRTSDLRRAWLLPVILELSVLDIKDGRAAGIWAKELSRNMSDEKDSD